MFNEQPFFENIVHIANKRVVVAADFKTFLGRENWLLMDGCDIDDGNSEDAICAFRVHAIDTKQDVVAILVKISDLVPDGTLMWLDADELAIRMEAS